MAMSVAAGVSPVLLAPVKLELPGRGQLKHYNSGVVGLGNLPLNLHYKQRQRLSQTLRVRSASLVCTASGLGKPSLHLNRRQQLNHASGLRAASLICAAALNARCGAEQTQTVEKPVSVISKAPIHEKSPLLDDGGTGFPPRDDDGGGGGGGGGGGWSGGFFFFGFLAFLGFLKDKESEGPYSDN